MFQSSADCGDSRESRRNGRYLFSRGDAHRRRVGENWTRSRRGEDFVLEVNDGSTPQSLQVVVSSEVGNASNDFSLSDMKATGTSVVIEGEIKLPPETAKGQVIELHASKVISVGKC